MRLGLCCVFKEAPIHFKSTTAAYLKRQGWDRQTARPFLSKIAEHNLEVLLQSITFCYEHGIGCFRIRSDLLPLATHPEFSYFIDDLPAAQKLFDRAGQCHSYILDHNIRLTFHPDQFVILNSPLDRVNQASLLELDYQAKLSLLLGADVMTLHAGGVYQDSIESLKRLSRALSELPLEIKKRIALENDDRSYTPSQLLPLCLEHKIPLVYDVHHHRCLPDSLSIEEASYAALKTWNREPLFHLSSPLNGWKGNMFRKHSDYIDSRDFPEIWKMIDPLTIEIEAKAKELAIFRLQQDLSL